MPDSESKTIDVSVGDVVAYLRIEGGFSEALSAVVRRRVLLDAADDFGVTVNDDELQRTADAYRAMHGLHKASDTMTWLRAKGITPDALEKHLGENIRISKARDQIAANCAVSIAENPAVKDLIRELSVEDWVSKKLAQ